MIHKHHTKQFFDRLGQRIHVQHVELLVHVCWMHDVPKIDLSSNLCSSDVTVMMHRIAARGKA
jgi:hypothetical protein